MMRIFGLAGLVLALAAGAAGAADYKTLRTLQAPPPIQPVVLPTGVKLQPVEFARLVIHPKDGEAWAIAYESVPVRQEGDTRAAYEFITWDGGRVEADTASFSRAFADELKKAGFATDGGGSSLFGNSSSASADLKVGVLVDDIKGRFCIDCPNMLNRKGVPASVVMNANWEIYSSLERKVIAKVTTTGGANSMTKLQGSVMPAVLDAFREHVRMLIATEEFRRVVTSPAGGAPSAPAAPAQQTIALVGASTAAGVPQASNSVAIVFAADGAGSGFLVSNDGYLLTNHHVVGGSKYVKLKWADGTESLGEVIRSNPRRDVALIKTESKGRAPLALRRSAVQQGETVFAIGTPLEEKLQNTMTKGIVSATREYEGQSFIQSDVGVTRGNSGGPLLDEKGAVIGLTVSGLHVDQSKSLNLFIPIDDALKVLALQPVS